MAEEVLLTHYYTNQATTATTPFYSGAIFHRGTGSLQRGAGIGSFLGGLYRRALPVLKKGAAIVGREVVNSGTHFVNDIAKNTSPCLALKKRSREAVINITNKTMTGGGYKKSSASGKKRQLSSGSRQSNTKRRRIVIKKKTKPATKKSSSKKTQNKKTRDIFTNII